MNQVLRPPKAIFESPIRPPKAIFESPILSAEKSSNLSRVSKIEQLSCQNFSYLIAGRSYPHSSLERGEVRFHIALSQDSDDSIGNWRGISLD